MKKIGIIIFAFVLTFLLSVPAGAVEHKEFYLTITIPDGFTEFETGDTLMTGYMYYDNTKAIGIKESLNLYNLDYSNLTFYDLSEIEEVIEDEYKEKGITNIISEPQASSVSVNSYKGVKIKTSYIDPNSGLEIYEDVYMFSTQTSYVYCVNFTSLSDDESWYAETLNSLIIGKGLLEETTSAETEGYTVTTTNGVSAYTTTDEDSSGAKVAENIGTVIFFTLIVPLLSCLFGNKKSRRKKENEAVTQPEEK
ncbi:MAG: hypothetical protein IJ491_06880 [Clostridia bacterium]|nr:hypothetical protein [Clostridia bacterium]